MDVIGFKCQQEVVSRFPRCFAPRVPTSSFGIFPFHRLQQIAGDRLGGIRCNAPGGGTVTRGQVVWGSLAKYILKDVDE